MSFLQKKSTSVLLLALCTLIVYSNIFHNPFLWDDHFLILQNSLIQDHRHLPDLFTTEFFSKNKQESNFSDGGYYRPLVSLSFAADYALWKENPFGYHLTNFLLHLLNVFLVYALGGIVWRGNRRAAFLTALLFGIHPIQTEAVSYTPSRVDLITAFFYLGAWILFDRSVRSHSRARLAGALTLFSLSLLSKEMAATLPALLVCYAFTFAEQDRRRAFFSTLPFWILLLNYFLFRTLFFPVTEKPLWGYLPRLPWALLSSGTLIFSYLRLLVFPHPLHLERTHSLIQTLWDLRVLSFLGLAGLSVWLFRVSGRREEKFLVAAFLIGLLPVLNVVPLYPSMAEHYLYLPSVSIFLLTAGLLEKKRNTACILIGCLVFLGFGIRTWMRNQDYADEISLFEKTRHYAPQSAMIHNNLGSIYATHGRAQEAIGEFQQALLLDPGNAATLANLGMAYRSLGDYEKAIAHYQMAIQLKPDPHFYNSLGVSYGFSGKTKEAQEAFKQAIALDPEFADAYFNLGRVYWDQKRWSDVEEIWRRGLEKNPRHALLKKWLEALEKTKMFGQK